jgi:hypothetical protein
MISDTILSYSYWNVTIVLQSVDNQSHRHMTGSHESQRSESPSPHRQGTMATTSRRGPDIRAPDFSPRSRLELHHGRTLVHK